MSQSDIGKVHNIPLRRLPSMRSGITVIWLEGSASMVLWENRDKTFLDLAALKNYYVVRYTRVSKCFNYLKRARTHEHVVVVIVHNDDSNFRKETLITAADIARLQEYRVIQSILVLSQTVEKSLMSSPQLSKHTKYDGASIVKIFRDHTALLTRLQFLLNSTENCGSTLFTAFNSQERALHDVRQKLGTYVWSNMYIGKFVYFSTRKHSLFDGFRKHSQQGQENEASIKLLSSHCYTQSKDYNLKPRNPNS